MKNNLIGLTVALTVGIILVGGLVAPTITALTDETRTYTNEGMPYAEVDDDTHTITVTSSAITVDGEEVDQTLFPGSFSEYTLIYSSVGFIRLNNTGIRVDFRTESGSDSANYSFSNGETVTIVIDGTTATVSSTNTDISSHTLSDVTHYISSEGDYVLSLKPIVSSSSSIYGAGQTNFVGSAYPASTYVYVTWYGNIDGISATLLSLNANSVPNNAYSSFVIDSTSVNITDLGDGLYRVDSVKLNYIGVASDTEYTMTSTYTYFLAPAEVTYDNPDYIGSAAAPLMLAIIVVTILALVMTAARAVTRD